MTEKKDGDVKSPLQTQNGDKVSGLAKKGRSSAAPLQMQKKKNAREGSGLSEFALRRDSNQASHEMTVWGARS